MLTIVLTRHGHTDRSEPDQYLGQRIDIALSTRGRDDAERLRERLAGVSFERVIWSPLHRAAETASIVAPGQRIEADRRLMEAVPVRDYRRWLRQDWLNLTVLRLDPDGRAQLLLANGTAHLRRPGEIPWL